ncbi:multicopper oxidase domain-containing protein [Nonomuraea sp. NBC_01738]|uniref:multicopper oxidase family protein n=1 Tax=Nonomuraea sp. NBC_01738 TaxID=2976003 RepID=UPI002E151C37|nr:multicopper oxidase domain-containing protein [Nonomuraea sp. NBC_01738]
MAVLKPFADALPVPPLLRPRGREVTVEMRSVRRRLHAQLPPTRLWTYEGIFPGPTIEVRSGQRVRLSWVNAVADEHVPVTAVQVPAAASIPINRPGREGAVPRADVAAITPWLVTHLHGAVTGANNDGWGENGVSPGESQTVEYLNEQPSAALWYHDHGMHVGTWTVFSGLLGAYLIRDEEEESLGLPEGCFEIPLILCDRNLDTDAAGLLTGDLLHKVQITATTPKVVTRAFAGPYTLVNGVIWPYAEVEPRWYRFRVLNASNARAYRLQLLDEDTGQPVTGVVRQIGTDGGLLPAPVPIDGALVLAPAERADLLVDFRGLRGKRVRWVNTTPGVAAGQPAPGANIPFPEVMQFRVGDQRPVESFQPPEVTSPSFVRTTRHSVPGDHQHRVVLTMVGGGDHAQMWEMAEDPGAAPGTEGVVQIDDRIYRRMARMPDDAVGFFATLGGWEMWTFLNVAQAMHPMHIHLMRFQILSRDIYDISGFSVAGGTTTKPLTRTGPGVIDPNEQGWKDIVRVERAEAVTVAGRFDGGTGRYAYHCHLLEHQDEGMMRPLLVFPPSVMRLRGQHAGHPHRLTDLARLR